MELEEYSDLLYPEDETIPEPEVIKIEVQF